MVSIDMPHILIRVAVVKCQNCVWMSYHLFCQWLRAFGSLGNNRFILINKWKLISNIYLFVKMDKVCLLIVWNIYTTWKLFTLRHIEVMLTLYWTKETSFYNCKIKEKHTNIKSNRVFFEFLSFFPIICLYFFYYFSVDFN